MKKTILSVLSILSLITLVISAESLGRDVLKNWEVILNNERAVFHEEGSNLFNVLKNAPRKQQPWCGELNALFERIMTAAKAGDVVAYKKCFAKNIDDETAKLMMTEWKDYNTMYVIKICAWVKSKNAIPTVFAFVPVPVKSKGRYSYKLRKKYGRSLFRRVIYVEKQDDGYKIITDFKNKKLETLVKTEVYPSLFRYMNKTEYALRKKVLAEMRAWNIAEQKRQNKVKRFNKFKKDHHLLMEKYGYSEKDMHKLFNDRLKRSNEVYPDMNQIGLTAKRFKRGLVGGHIKVLTKPMLIPDTSGKLTNEPNSKTLAYALKKECYLYLNNYGARFNAPAVQIMAYEKITFRDIDYYDFYGISCNLKESKLVFSRRFSRFTYDKIKQEGRRLRMGTHDRTIEPEEKAIIYSMLSRYGLRLKYVIDPPKSNPYAISKKSYSQRFGKSIYHERLKAKNLYKFFRVRKPEECILYKPGIDILKLPTIPVEDFNFPELDK